YEGGARIRGRARKSLHRSTPARQKPPQQRCQPNRVESHYVPASVATAVPDLSDGFLAFGLALVIALLATPVAGALAWRIGAIDEPRERGLHQFPTPRLGGLAILVAVVVAALVFLPHDQQTRGILLGAGVIALVGSFDDLLELSADFKLVGQLLAAAVPVASGVRVENFTLPFVHRVDLTTPESYALTILGIVALMNVVNFIDGVDGLAAGVCTIAAGTFAAIALSLNRDAAGVLALIVAGAALGYLRHGFHPASIFLGPPRPLQRQVEPRSRRRRPAGVRGERLPRARARDPEAQAIPPVPAAAPAHAARRAAARRLRGRRDRGARAGDRRVRGGRRA